MSDWINDCIENNLTAYMDDVVGDTGCRQIIEQLERDVIVEFLYQELDGSVDWGWDGYGDGSDGEMTRPV